MRVITEKEADILKNVIINYFKSEKSEKIITGTNKDLLNSLGFERCELGTGDSASTSSMRVRIMNIKSTRYLNGKYLVVGTSARTVKKGKVYLGYAIKIEN